MQFCQAPEFGKRPLVTCTRCVMDETAGNIVFDENGHCNYCRDFLKIRERYLEPDPAARDRRLDQLIYRVRRDGRGKPYDCIIGVSGGVDSSWALAKAVELGLRPLAVHMDNGWNAELAQNNIANLVRGCGVPLYTHVINWPEYRGLMEAFFSSDVIDVELLYDNAMNAVNHAVAAKFGLKYILGGTNVATEGMPMPPGWNWFKYDKVNIKGISKRFGGPSLSTFPAIGTIDYIRYYLKGIRWVSFLDHFDFSKRNALQTLQGQFNYKPYPFKHYESVFTRFYQGYILPTKFGVDKRKLHLSTLIISGEIERQEAEELLRGSPYESERLLRQDTRYFLRKMGWSQQKLDAYLARPPIRHDAYPTEISLWRKAEAAFIRSRALVRSRQGKHPTPS